MVKRKLVIDIDVDIAKTLIYIEEYCSKLYEPLLVKQLMSYIGNCMVFSVVAGDVQLPFETIERIIYYSDEFPFNDVDIETLSTINTSICYLIDGFYRRNYDVGIDWTEWIPMNFTYTNIQDIFGIRFSNKYLSMTVEC